MSEASLASLFGASPVRRSSGKVDRHSLNRGGNRQANRALHTIARARLAHDGRTIAYAQRRRAEGKSDREIERILVRYIVREVFRALTHPTVVRERRGAELRARPRALGLTQREVGELLGVASSRVSEMERDKRWLPELEGLYDGLLGELEGTAGADAA